MSDDKEFMDYLQKQSCSSCGKCINLPELIMKSECKDVIVINYHDNNKENQNVLFCSRECFESYDEYGNIHCVVCDNRRTTSEFDLGVRFEKLGGWLSIRGVCSEACKTQLKADSFQDAAGAIDLELEKEKTCWYCKKVSDVALQRCSRCKVAYYCNVTCQTAHWGEHRVECSNK